MLSMLSQPQSCLLLPMCFRNDLPVDALYLAACLLFIACKSRERQLEWRLSSMRATLWTIEFLSAHE